jgi:hypothetical protein
MNREEHHANANRNSFEQSRHNMLRHRFDFNVGMRFTHSKLKP